MNPGASFVIEITFPCALIGQRVELSLSGYLFSPLFDRSGFVRSVRRYCDHSGIDWQQLSSRREEMANEL